jgi:ribosomal-protein-alanine N-acetyltransferase
MKLTLRPIEAADWPAVNTWARLPEFSRYQPFEPSTEDQSRDFVAAAAAAWSETPQTRFAYLACVDGEPAGVGEIRVHNEILKKVGMTYEGRMRHTLLLRDGWRDTELFSILGDEWRCG